MNALQSYIKATEKLCEEFYKKYYHDPSEGKYVKDPDDWYVIGGYRNMGPDVVGIADDYWNLTDMYTALLNNIDRDILFEWYSEYRAEDRNQGYMNLWHYYINSKGRPIHTQEEIEQSERAVEKAKKQFEESLDKYNK